MSYVLAKTTSGAMLTFNTKAQTGRNSELFCELVRVQQPAVISADSPQPTARSQIPSTLVSLRGAMIGASGCSLSVINTTEIKKSRFVSHTLCSPSLTPHRALMLSPVKPFPKNVTNLTALSPLPMTHWRLTVRRSPHCGSTSLPDTNGEIIDRSIASPSPEISSLVLQLKR
jgi:hypothetical protein